MGAEPGLTSHVASRAQNRARFRSQAGHSRPLVQRPQGPCLCRPQGMRPHLLLLLLQQLRCEQAQRQEGALLPGLLPEAERGPRVPRQHQLGHQPGRAQPRPVTSPGRTPGHRRPRSGSATALGVLQVPPSPLPHCGCLAGTCVVQCFPNLGTKKVVPPI